MNELMCLEFKGQQVRHVFDEHNEPWWVAKDVCDVLGLENAREALTRLDDDEKNTVRISDGIPGNPNMNVVNEPGLYKLIMRSNKPEAKEFDRWVRHEVLPSIRQTGAYMPSVSGLIEQVKSAVNEAIEPVKREIVKLNNVIYGVFDTGKNIENYFKATRKFVDDRTKEILGNVVIRYYSGLCPCCLKKLIVINGKLTRHHYDHWRNWRWRYALQVVWPICIECNKRFESDPAYRNEKEIKWSEWKERVGLYLGAPYIQKTLFPKD